MPDARLHGLGVAVLGAAVLGTAALGSACWTPLKEPDDGVGGGTSTTTVMTAGSTGAMVATSVASSSSTGDPGWPDDEPPPYLFERCPQASAWSIACMTITGMGVVAFDPEASDSCAVTPLDGDIDPIFTGSLALVGDAIFVCDEAAERILRRIDVLTGEVEDTTVACDAITDASDVLYGLSLEAGPGDVVIASTFEDYVQGNVTETDIAPHASRLAARNTDLYASWHVASSLEHWDLATQTQLGTITLQDFDEAVMGIAALDDGRIVILTSDDVVVFSSTGARVSVGEKPSALSSGLRCYTP